MNKIVIVCGPTAVGKTQVSLQLAQIFEGEIVSADSQQVYIGCDIGTDKARLQESEKISHHLIDLVSPADPFNVGEYVERADEAIAQIVSRGKRPFVVGGTGMYIRILLHGICAAPPQDPALRDKLNKRAEAGGTVPLHQELKEKDPETAKCLHPNDRQRIVRALEVWHLTGESLTKLQEGHRFQTLRYDALAIGLNCERELLYQRINARVDQMMERGLLAEVKKIIEDAGSDCPALKGVGYRELTAYLQGEMTLEEAILKTKQNTRRFAKRQLTWFRSEPQVEWFSPEDLQAIEKRVAKFLGR